MNLLQHLQRQHDALKSCLKSLSTIKAFYPELHNEVKEALQKVKIEISNTTK